MKDVTLIIQGRISLDAFNWWVNNYKNLPVIISTWVDCDINFREIPKNFTIILSQYPENYGDQNLNLQLTSTLAALEKVKTKYAIKIRADEYWSNLDYVVNTIKGQPNKIHTSSVFFRAWQYAEYHISDHMIAGTTENMLLMFRETKYNFDNNKINKSKWKHEDGSFWKWGHIHAPEERLTRSYLYSKEPFRYEKVDGRILMSEHFNILDADLLHPYKIKANIFQKIWYDGFIPERNFSISTIEQLFSDDPYKRNDGR
jgi:hypothetical protein